MPKKFKPEMHIRRWRMKEELAMKLMVTLAHFKSEEEPKLKITKKEKLSVLAQLVHKYACFNEHGE